MTRSLARAATPFLTLAALLGLFHVSAPHYSTVLWWEVRAALYWLLPLVGLFALIGAVFLVGRWKEAPGWLSPRWLNTLLTMVALGGLVAGLWWVVSTHGYLQARDYWTRSAAVSTGTAPEVGQRAPYQVALQQARPNLGEVSGDVVDTTFLPQRGSYSTLVKRRGWASSGYEVVLDQTIPLAGGRGSGVTCRFDTDRAARRDGGWWSHNLARAIHNARRNVRYDSGDLYAYCDKDRPVVVVPLKRQVGWLVVTERPAGVALYDGHTGRLTLRDSAEGIPGPAYPLSLAAQQREALTASSGYWDYRAGRSGWESSEDDTNSGNTTEFVLPLVRSANRPVYVTMLTGRGSATAIAAIATVDGRARAGDLAPIRVHRARPSWVSPSAITSRIKSDYQDLPNWQNQQVMEIAPIDGNRWVATIGNGQNVLYRVQGTGSLQGDTPTCLFRANGTRIRCGTLADQDGRGVGTDYGPSGNPGADPGGTPTPAPGDLGRLTDKELADLQRRVAEEVARRLETGR